MKAGCRNKPDTLRASLRRVFSREGYYGKRIADSYSLWLWSAGLALLCTFISYPGIWYSDSYVRVTTGNAVLNAMVKTLTGHRAPLDTRNAFTVIPSFFMAISQGLTGHVGLYTFGQAFAFFAATFLLIRELNLTGRRLQGFLFAICPLIYGMSVYYEAGIGCVTGIVGLMLLLRRTGEEKYTGDRIVSFLLAAFFSFVIFGYRTNALTIVPVLVFYLLRRKPERNRKGTRRLTLLAVVLGLICTRAVPWVFDVHSMSTATTGIVWEMLTAIQRMDPEDQEKYGDYLDEIGGEGSTRAALATSTEYTAGDFMWDEDLGIGKMSAPGATGTALRKYVRLMVERPREWFGVKRDVILRSMGIQGKLDYSEYNYNRWDQMTEYGMNDSLQRRAFYDSFVYTVSVMDAWVLRPWVSFLVTLILVLAEWIRKNRRREAFLLTLGLAAFYYLAYLLDTPAYDFRYFYPSLYLMTILDAAILWGWAGKIRNRVRNGRGKGRKAAPGNEFEGELVERP